MRKSERNRMIAVGKDEWRKENNDQSYDEYFGRNWLWLVKILRNKK
jgi:hypothetical protein